VGWRGFALDRLQEQCHPIVAALVVGIFWGLWHIPLFFLTGSGMTSFPLWPWFAGLIGRSYLVAWLYNRSCRSLPVAIAFHLASNIFGAFLGVDSFGALAAVTVAAVAAVIAASGGRLGKQIESAALSTDMHHTP